MTDAFPNQPFYRFVKRLPLERSVAARPEYSGTLPASVKEDAQRLFIVRFKMEKQPFDCDNIKARVKVNGEDYWGLPFTMVNIGPLCQGAANKIDISFGVLPNPVTVLVEEVIKVSEENLLRSLPRNNSHVHEREVTKDLVRAQFAQADDDAIVQCLEVSLICPLSQKKMVAPSRGAACIHVQCFDAFSYLAVNEATLRPSWSCPVCSREVFVEDLRIDLLTLDILKETEGRYRAVRLLADASWEQLSTDDSNVVLV